MKTLYISDLDGTLLNSSAALSDFTKRTINSLLAADERFTYATARAWSTSHQVAAGIEGSLPVVVHNGAFIANSLTGERLIENTFDRSDYEEMLRDVLKRGINPLVYALEGGRERFSFVERQANEATRAFLDMRKGDGRDREVSNNDELFYGDRYFYMTCIDSYEMLAPLYEKYKNIHHCVFLKYKGLLDHSIEILPKQASKSNATRQVADHLGCDRIVAFGDSINDLDLFEIADESYAVANAAPELKAKASGIIGSNDEDGVAHWLCERLGLEVDD
ncbi:MAG: HAD family hydrolase [bacterium]|nr:HAD family hydrolase [bacterium]